MPVVEIVNTTHQAMATANYSVPDDVTRRFNEAFADRNKSAIVADLMRQAVEEERQRERHVAAIDEILARRADGPAVTPEQIRAAREEGRP